MEHWITRAAASAPRRQAVGALTYEALEDRARSAAGAMREQGISHGSRVALALPPGAEFAVALHACFLAGAVAVPLDLRLSADERRSRSAGAALLIEAVPEGSAPVPSRELVLDEVATVMHTSGTSATPRAVGLSYGNWLANALGSAAALGLHLAERWLCPMPLAHVGGLSILIRSAIYGTSVDVHGRFEVEAVLAALSTAAERITLVSLVPTMLARLLDAGLREPPTLRWALLGGAPIPGELLERARRAGVPVAPTYGMTEACSQIATNGWPLAGVDVRLSEDHEVLVRGAVVAAESLAGDGWLHTGDLGALDERGRLQIIGRKSDTIVTGGENVAPAEVEAVLLEHPAVADAGVHARPDPEWGEVLLASVVLRAGARSVGADELREFCRGRLAGFKTPKEFKFVSSLPRTHSGKLLRRDL